MFIFVLRSYLIISLHAVPCSDRLFQLYVILLPLHIYQPPYLVISHMTDHAGAAAAVGS